MAFKNFIKTNSYTAIENISLDKKNKNLSFKIVVYSDEKKQNILFENSFNYIFNKKIIDKSGEIVDTLEQVTKSKLEEGLFLVRNENAIYNKKIVKFYNSDGKVEKTEIINDKYFLDTDYINFNNTTIYKLNFLDQSNPFQISQALDTEKTWNELGFIDKNIYEVVYEFCKQLEIFEGVEDC